VSGSEDEEAEEGAEEAKEAQKVNLLSNKRTEHVEAKQYFEGN